MYTLLLALVIGTPPDGPLNRTTTATSAPVSGANLCSSSLSIQRMEAAAKAGIKTIRITPSRWKGKTHDFLVGDALNYTQLVEDDLAILRRTLDDAHRLGLRVVVAMRTIPGRRWARDDVSTANVTLWSDAVQQERTVAFWTHFASKLGTHPALMAIDPIPRPRPLGVTKNLTDIESEQFAATVATSRGTLVDSDTLYARIISGVRKSSRHLPVVVQPIGGGAPKAFRYLRPQADPAVIYGFQAFEPHAFTGVDKDASPYHYPGKMPALERRTMEWNKGVLLKQYQDVLTFQRNHSISSLRIMAVEYGAHRLARGVVGYMNHLTDIFHTAQWHRFFFCYRSPESKAYDYELGTRVDSTTRSNNTLWQALTRDISRASILK